MIILYGKRPYTRIERSLDELKRKIVNDFRWLLPQEPVQQQKKSLFGFKK